MADKNKLKCLTSKEVISFTTYLNNLDSKGTLDALKVSRMTDLLLVFQYLASLFALSLQVWALEALDLFF